MTEEEAKMCACCGPPAVANAILLASPHLLAKPLNNLGMCIGRSCMAWTWHSTNGLGIRTGFCGLAGKP